MRVGIGHDTHRLAKGRPLILGSVRIDHPRGLEGHSDADVVLHAIIDALLGAAGLGDIGDAFADTDAANKDKDSRIFLTATLERLKKAGWRVVNVDATIFAQEPKLGPAKLLIRQRLMELLALPPDAINLKAKTGERLGHIGRAEGIACQAVALIDKLDEATETKPHAKGEATEAKPPAKDETAAAKPPAKKAAAKPKKSAKNST